MRAFLVLAVLLLAGCADEAGPQGRPVDDSGPAKDDLPGEGRFDSTAPTEPVGECEIGDAFASGSDSLLADPVVIELNVPDGARLAWSYNVTTTGWSKLSIEWPDGESDELGGFDVQGTYHAYWGYGTDDRSTGGVARMTLASDPVGITDYDLAFDYSDCAR